MHRFFYFFSRDNVNDFQFTKSILSSFDIDSSMLTVDNMSVIQYICAALSLRACQMVSGGSYLFTSYKRSFTKWKDAWHMWKGWIIKMISIIQLCIMLLCKIWSSVYMQRKSIFIIWKTTYFTKYERSY